MKRLHNYGTICGNARGGVLVLLAILLVVLIGIAALAIDIGHITTTRNELQDVADAAALAGAGEMGAIYVSLDPVQMPGYTFGKSAITAAALDAALKNRASNVDIVIRNDNAINAYDNPSTPVNNDIVIGVWDEGTGLVTPTLTEPDAVYVKARRDTKQNSPITTFFAGILGIDQASVTAEAVASLSGPSTVAEGELFLPVGLSENVFKYPGVMCTDLIQFSPTPSSCAAWHNFEDAINGDAMEDKLIGIIEGHPCEDCGALTDGVTWMEANFEVRHNPQYPGPVVTPSYSAGAIFEFSGGQISKLLTPGSSYLLADYDEGVNSGNVGTIEGNAANPQDMTALFDYFRYRDGDGNDAEWSTSIPVYQDTTVQDGDNTADCDNANDDRKIVGFARIVMEQTNPPPATSLAVRVDCDFTVIEGRGGAGTFGNVVGSVPHLVK